jgi:hypothetical protein
MSDEDLRKWVVDELSAGLLSESDARHVTEAMGAWLAHHAADAVAVARIVRERPDAAAWWRSERSTRAREALHGGSPDEAFVTFAEMVGDAAPDVWDTNWPDNKFLWAVGIPPSAEPGDRFLIGDGMGMRALAEVVERDGVRGAAIVPGSCRHTLRPWVDAAGVEAEELAAR